MNLDKLFHLKENHTDVKTEVMAGITTFMTMANILAVNPNILEASGMDRSSIRISVARTWGVPKIPALVIRLFFISSSKIE